MINSFFLTILFLSPALQHQISCQEILLEKSYFLEEIQGQEIFVGEGSERTVVFFFFFFYTNHFCIFTCCCTWCFQSRSRGVSYCFGLVLIILHICSSQRGSTDVNACTKGKSRVVYKCFRCVLALVSVGRLLQTFP